VVICNPVATHVRMANLLMGKPVSAGFVRIDPDDGDVVCFGESVSLGLEPREGDAMIVINELGK